MLILAVYCAVMVAPAMPLLAGRIAFGRLLEPPLAAIEGRVTNDAASATGWILGIAGFVIACGAAWRLGLFDQRLR